MVLRGNQGGGHHIQRAPDPGCRSLSEKSECFLWPLRDWGYLSVSTLQNGEGRVLSIVERA